MLRENPELKKKLARKDRFMKEYKEVLKQKIEKKRKEKRLEEKEREIKENKKEKEQLQKLRTTKNSRGQPKMSDMLAILMAKNGKKGNW